VPEYSSKPHTGEFAMTSDHPPGNTI